MIRIRTPSRLHFGLFSLPSEHAAAWLNQEGETTLPRRQFGGVGLMIDRPGLELTVEPAATWSSDGPLAERALSFAQMYCDSIGVHEMFHLQIESAPPDHVGLGTGTQLALAVARGIAELTGQLCNGPALASFVGRGRRSAIGVHGFERGGFLIEGGKSSDNTLSPLLVQQNFPGDWRILLITPRELQGVHGRREIDAFADLANQERDNRATETLCRLVLLGMLPALIEEDLPTFGEALYDFNRRVGEMFRPAQGGVYAHPRSEEIVRGIRAAGVKGVGQSSWGPTIFAGVAKEQAMEIRDRLIRKDIVSQEEIIITRASNGGAQMNPSPSASEEI